MKYLGIVGLLICTALQLSARDVILVYASDTNECLFSSTCLMPEGETTSSEFFLEGNEGAGVLSVRTFPADPDTAAAGRHVYLFRIDLRDMTGTNCIQRMTIPFGEIVTDFDYDANGTAGDDVFVNARLIDPGDFGPLSATLDGGQLSFVFDDMCPGTLSYWLGVISSDPPGLANIEVLAAAGGAIVEGRAPAMTAGQVLANLRAYIANLSSASIDARTEKAQEKRRAALLKLLDKAEKKLDRNPKPVLAHLRAIERRADGLKKDWIVDDPETPQNEPAELVSLVQEASAAIGR